MDEGAGNGQLADRLRHLIRCVVCNGIFENLKLLEPCQHLTCMSCLQIMAKDVDKFNCIECSQVILVPNGGLKKLKDSLMTKQIASMLELKSDLPETVAETSPHEETSSTAEGSIAPGTQSATELLASEVVSAAAENISIAEDQGLTSDSHRRNDASQSQLDKEKIEAKASKVFKNRKKCRELRNELEKKAEEGFGWLRKIETNLSVADDMMEKLPNQVKELKQRVIRVRDQKRGSQSVHVGNRITQAASTKLESLETLRRVEQQALENYKREMEPKFYEVREVLKDVEVIVKDLSPKSSKTMVVKALTTVGKLKTFDFQRVLMLNEITRGDSVRLQLNPEKMKSIKDLLREEDYTAVGHVAGFEQGKFRVIMPNNNMQQLISPKDLIISLTPSTEPNVDDTVKIKVHPVRNDFVYEQDFHAAVDWFTNKTEGILFANQFIRPELLNVKAKVVFPGGRVWEGKHDQLELVQFGMKRGTEMRLRGSREPSSGFCGVSYDSVGTLKTSIIDRGIDEDIMVDFPECHSWRGKDSDVHLFRHPMVEEAVKPYPDVDINRVEWEGIRRDETGIVVKLLYDDDNRKMAIVRFGTKLIKRPLEEFYMIDMEDMESVMQSFASLHPLEVLLTQIMKQHTQ